MATSELDGLSSLLSGPAALSSGATPSAAGGPAGAPSQHRPATEEHHSSGSLTGPPIPQIENFNPDNSQRRRGRGVVQGRALPPGLTMAIDTTAREVQAAFYAFLKEFHEMESEELIYMAQLADMIENERTTLYVDFTHLSAYNQELADAIFEEFLRYEPYLRNSIEALVKENVQNMKRGIREVRSSSIGQLGAISGTVTRTSEVRPELVSGTFSCRMCGQVVREVLQQFKYTTPPVCPNALCNNNKEWDLVVEQSTFVDWQKIRVQENSDEIPPGSMPRTMQVIVRNEIVEKAKPGDKCVFTGCTIVIPDVAQLTGAAQGVSKGEGRINRDYEGVTGLQGMGVRDLTYKIAFLAVGVQPLQQRPGDVNIRTEDDAGMPEFTEEEIKEITEMSREPRLYTTLANCIAPNVFGHKEIKRGLLLMLIGGVHKSTRDAGMSLRGDVNICLVGDPSTAKSQFLKWVCSFMSRAVYTSGKASSAAGLTASVGRDPETGEYGIEAGAMLLADNGICCIDEFDKMDPKDQVAIHEAMEQQTISIAKAGIQATLNARASVLAAANPIYGRYDLTKTLKQNLNITAPIMSRFDLFYVVVDQCDPEMDDAIARTIVAVKQNNEEALTPRFSQQQMQRYIAYARSIKPRFTDESKRLIASHYCRLRENDVTGASKSSYRITVRQLESMIRLSEALARLHLSEEILPQYVNEAARLIRTSIVRVQSEELSLDDLDEQIQQDDVKMGEVEVESNEDVAADVQPAESQPAEEAQRKLHITRDEYQRVAHMLVLHIQQSRTQSSSFKDLETWYLHEKEREGRLNSQADLQHQTRLIKNILRRLVQKDHILIENGDQVLVHPNYDLENDT